MNFLSTTREGDNIINFYLLDATAAMPRLASYAYRMLLKIIYTYPLLGVARFREKASAANFLFLGAAQENA
jgi:hypothetical protein